MAITSPPATGSAPPDRPVPWPRATNGTPAFAQSRTIACTSAADEGNATAAGVSRRWGSASHS